MNTLKRGFLIKKKGKIKINHKKTNAVLLNKLQVDLLLANRKYMKGYLLDAGCGEKPYSLIYDETVEKSMKACLNGAISYSNDKLSINEERCNGCGVCMMLASELFGMKKVK